MFVFLSEVLDEEKKNMYHLNVMYHENDMHQLIEKMMIMVLFLI